MPKLKAILFASITACAAVGASVAAGRYAVDLLETRLVAQARAALTEQDDWLKITASGQQLTLSGAAPADDARTAALARVMAAGLSAVILDTTEIAPKNDREPARQPMADLGVEIVFGPGATTIFGRVPEGADAAKPFLELAEALEAAPMLSPQRGRVPGAWDASVALAVRAAGLLERGRITVTPGQVEIRANAASDTAREEALEALRPGEGVTLDAEISAPRRVISPFAFEASLSEAGKWQVVRCAAATVEGRDRILAVLGPGVGCEVGLGAPSPDWAAAVVTSLQTLEEMGAGRLEIADTDIAVTGVAGQKPEDFMARTGDLAERLPDVFSLSATLPQPEAAAAEDSARPPASFSVTRGEDGRVAMSGQLPDARVQATAQTFAEAQFGMGAVDDTTKLSDGLPAGWTGQVLAGLEVVGMLNNGSLELSASALRLEGTISTMRVREEIQRILGERLPDDIQVTLKLDEAPMPLTPAVTAAVPAELCAEQIDLEMARDRIDFPPSKSDIDKDSLPVIDRIAEIMGQCPGARFEIGGHTDSQGRESSNMALSQARADAVLAALLERDVDTVFLYAKGYGESQPIATNETEEGRAANRRIAFRLVTDEAPAPEAAEEGMATPDEAAAPDEDAEQDATDGEQAETDTPAPAAQEAAPEAPDPPGAEAESDAELGDTDAAPAPPDEAQRVESPDDGGTPPEPDETAAAPDSPPEEDAGTAEEAPQAQGETGAGADDGATPVVSRAAQLLLDDLETGEVARDGDEEGPTRPRLRPWQLNE